MELDNNVACGYHGGPHNYRLKEIWQIYQLIMCRPCLFRFFSKQTYEKFMRFIR